MGTRLRCLNSSIPFEINGDYLNIYTKQKKCANNFEYERLTFVSDTTCCSLL